MINHQVVIIKTDMERKFTDAIFQELAAIFRDGDWETISAFFAIYMAKQITDYVNITDIQAFRIERGIPLKERTLSCSSSMIATLFFMAAMAIAILARLYGKL